MHFRFPFFLCVCCAVVGLSNSPVSFWPESRLQCIIYGLQTWPNPWPNRPCPAPTSPAHTKYRVQSPLLGRHFTFVTAAVAVALLSFRFIFWLHNLLSPQKHLNYGSWPDTKPGTESRYRWGILRAGILLSVFVSLICRGNYKTLTKLYSIKFA